MIKASELKVGDYIRGTRNASKIYRVTEDTTPTRILVRRYDSVNKVSIDSDFMFLIPEQVVEKVTI